ncbi:MAG: DNA polymerase I [Bacteroidales bacterium]|nr:DNA polymerase I [Bacteroidales bacterium]MCF8454920.1 DNA polymerase I [Bacteroidales bacterium]
MDTPKKLFLLDAYALIYRSYFAFIRMPRINSKGLNTSAIFGFTNTLDQVLQQENPTHIAVVFDPPGPTFRHEMFAPYKANRDETPEDIRKAIPYIKQIIEGYNIESIQVMGYEADDVIGTLAKKADEEGYEVFMMTPDKDYAQLVTEKVKMYKPGRSGNEVEILGIEEVKKKFGIENPSQVIDILALWGDSSDNIPGAPGIGEKTSQKLVAEYGSVEGLLQKTHELKGKQKESIENNVEPIKLSKVLATIKTDVPVEFGTDQLVRKEMNRDKLKEVFEELEFRTMAQRILQQTSAPQQTKPTQHPQQTSLFNFDEEPAQEFEQRSLDSINTIDHNYVLVESGDDRKELISKLSGLKEFCFDSETTSKDVNNAEIVGLSFSWKAHEAFYVPLPDDRSQCLNVLEEFKPLFENPEIGKIGQNIKYDISMLKWYGMDVQGQLFDTMLAHYLLEPDHRHGMDYLAEVYLGYKPISFNEVCGSKGKAQITMREAYKRNPELVKDYAAEDADITWQLKEIMAKGLADKELTKLAEEIEMPLVPVLADMEKTGVKLNGEALKLFAEDLTQTIFATEKEIIKMAGQDFNVSSPKQLGEVLFDRMKLDDKAKKTKTGQYSTNEETLARIQDKHPIIARILEYRGQKKLLSTYVEALPLLINKKTGKIHTSYNQAVAATGRLSSVNPNLQNIPIREEQGREIRRAFIPSDENHTFFSADYSQIELRLMAHLSEDPNLLEAFQNNEDIHTATAAKINKIPIAEVTRDMRSKAKTANFGIIYGISAFGLSQRLNISRSEGKDLIDGYFESYPKVKEYMDESIRIAREKGYVETLLGRRRQLADINSRNAVVRGMAERNAINAPIQGSAADIIKLAMINIYHRFNEEKLQSKMILQVHDELNFDVYKPELEKVREIVIHEMQNAVSLKVPLIVDYGMGENWLEAH